VAEVEYTETIPCGQPLPETDTDPWYVNAGNATSAFSRSVDGEWTDMRPLVREYTGDPAEIATDDFGFMEADVTGFSAAVNAAYDSTGRKGLRVHGIMDRGFVMPEGGFAPSWAGVWVVRAPLNARLGLQMSRRHPDDGSELWNGIVTTETATGDWQRITLGYSESGTVYADTLQALYDGRYSVQSTADRPISGSASYEPEDFETAFLGVLVSYWLDEDAQPTTLRRLPPNRILQRGNDGLGITGGRRILGAKTLQSSNRATGIR
jgi:hypothetical protein